MPLAQVPEPGQGRAGTRAWGFEAWWWLVRSLVNLGQAEPPMFAMSSAPHSSWQQVVCISTGHREGQPLPGARTLVLNSVLPSTSHMVGPFLGFSSTCFPKSISRVDLSTGWKGHRAGNRPTGVVVLSAYSSSIV